MYFITYILYTQTYSINQSTQTSAVLKT